MLGCEQNCMNKGHKYLDKYAVYLETFKSRQKPVLFDAHKPMM